MKILVINSMLEQKHVDLIKKVAGDAGAHVFFYTDEAEIPQVHFDADIIYGFAPAIVKAQQALENQKSSDYAACCRQHDDFLYKG